MPSSSSSPAPPAPPELPPIDRGATRSASATERPAGEADEAALVARLKAGDNLAYEFVVRTYSARLLAVIRRIVGDDEDAQDVLQETFLSAFRSVGRFAGGSLLSTWLHRIAVNASLMRLRTRRRKPEQPIEALLPTYKEDGHHTETFSSWDPPVDVALENERVRALVRQQIGALPERYRVVLMMRDIEELDTEETARLLGITPNAVKIRLHRARQALRTLLAPHFRRDRQ